MSTLFLEAFGQLSPGTNLIDAEEEDLYSVFRARAELMGWSSTSIPRSRRPMLWDMNEAELTVGTDASRIGWVQVGLEVLVTSSQPECLRRLLQVGGMHPLGYVDAPSSRQWYCRRWPSVSMMRSAALEISSCLGSR